MQTFHLLWLSVSFVLISLNLCDCSIDLTFGHQCHHEVPRLRDVSQFFCYLYIIYVPSRSQCWGMGHILAVLAPLLKTWTLRMFGQVNSYNFVILPHLDKIKGSLYHNLHLFLLYWKAFLWAQRASKLFSAGALVQIPVGDISWLPSCFWGG